jgi:hypothetical protein
MIFIINLGILGFYWYNASLGNMLVEMHFWMSVICGCMVTL